MLLKQYFDKQLRVTWGQQFCIIIFATTVSSYNWLNFNTKLKLFEQLLLSWNKMNISPQIFLVVFILFMKMIIVYICTVLSRSASCVQCCQYLWRGQGGHTAAHSDTIMVSRIMVNTFRHTIIHSKHNKITPLQFSNFICCLCLQSTISERKLLTIFIRLQAIFGNIYAAIVSCLQRIFYFHL